MNVERWREVDKILQDALELPPSERAPFLDRACAHDATLRQELQRLIQSYERAGNFLENPVALSIESRPAGTTIGPYVLDELIGVGGMGQVYRATDTRLGRAVALKMVREEFVQTPEFRDRVEREARAIASLNHPHICALYDIGEHDGTTYLVMEHLSGELLCDVLKRGRLAAGKALEYAKEIADALAAVHARGILHRDLKPGNVMITTGGVKVLDFGLAKIETAEPSRTSHAPSEGVSHSGLVLGTAAYMSPEQARGQAVDKRTDIWAFGCLLYEMLTGKRSFTGSGTTEILAAVLKNEPDWSALPAGLAPSIPRLLRACLEKDVSRRIPDIAAVLFLMDEPASTEARVTHRSLLRIAALFLIFAAGVAVAATKLEWRTGPRTLHAARLSINTAGVAALAVSQRARDLAISPDGSRIVYVGNNGTQLFLRALDQLEPRPLTPAGYPFYPFFSPDGQWVGFFHSGVNLRKVAISGGPVTAITKDVAAIGIPFGATWGADGTIVFADMHKLRGLQRVSADGGQPTVMTRPNPQAGEADHAWPEFLPGGKAVLFTITSTSGQLGDAQIAVLDLQTGKYKSVLRTGSHAHYVKTGHLVYGASGTLRAIRFDLNSLETVGPPVPVLSQVVTTEDGAADFDISEDGTLAYVTGGVQSVARSLVWVDRQGREEPLKAPARAFIYPRLSPDGSRIALDVRDQDNDIWIWDIARETMMRLTRDPATEMMPIWKPDGRHLLYSSSATGSPNLYSQLADGSAPAERLTQSPTNQFAHSVTRDGRWLVFSESTSEIRRSLKMLAFDSPQRSQTLVQTPFVEQNGALSPNERWLAYESNETGEFEVYVRPFPGVNGGEWKISTSGGRQPVWRRDSAELFFWDKTGGLMSVTVQQGPEWAAGVPSKILEPRYYRGNDAAAPTYDVSPDGRRFLVIKPLTNSNENANPMSLVVAQNWFEELKRLFAGK